MNIERTKEIRVKRTVLVLFLVTLSLIMAYLGVAVIGETEPSITEASSFYRSQKSAQDVRAITTAMERFETVPELTAELNGSITAKKGFVNYTQTISGYIERADDLQHTHAESHSAFINVTHDSYANRKEVRYTTNGNPEVTTSYKEYSAVYGEPYVCPDGHTINARTIVTTSSKDEENGFRVINFTLNHSTACNGLRTRMMHMGSLTNIPIYSENPSLTLTIDKSGNPVKLSTLDKYVVTVSFLGTLSCTQQLDFSFHIPTTV